MHELTEIGRKYGTDKAGGRAGNHVFTEEVYGPLFESRKNEPLHLLEIGVGLVGGSHKMWKEYFTQGNIYCMDPFFLADQAVTIEELQGLGIEVIRGNQLRRDDLHRAGASCSGGYDVIIDDAAHMPDAIQLSLGVLFPYLKSGGYYIVEDLSTATRRGSDLEATNANLTLLDTAGIMQERHVRDYTLEAAFTHFRAYLDGWMENAVGVPWLSEIMTDTEKQYLIDNMAEWQFFNDGARRNNIVIIKKK
jgi:hypothetical protein